ncbi:MAG: O-antigen ligase family protein [Campylobacterota bacterium]
MMLRLFSFEAIRPYREQSALAANYLLILYAFLLPVAPKTATQIFIAAALIMFFSGNLKEKFFNALKNKVIISFILFYTMYVFWTLGSEHIATAFFKLKEFKYILHIIIIYMIVQKRFVFMILGSFILGIIFSALTSYLLFFDYPVSAWLDYVPLIELHPAMHVNVPFMVSYTAYSISLSITANILLFSLLKNRHPGLFFNAALFILFLGVSSVVFLIASRLGYILYSLSISLTIGYVFRQYLFRAILIIVAFLGTTYLIAYENSEIFKNRFSAIAEETRKSFNASYTSGEGMRIAYYLYGWEVIKENSVFGVGTGDHIAEVFKIIDRKETDPANKNMLYMNYHSGDHASFDSEYLDTLVQFGIVGLLIFFNIIYQMIRYIQPDSRLKYIQYLLAFTITIVSLPSIILIPSEVGKVLILLISLTLVQPCPEDSKLISPSAV